MCFEARAPRFRSFLERLQTFGNWSRPQSPESLARAGFFRTQNGVDEVKCFCCGIQICDWEPLDDPLSEHLRWSSSCSFANYMKRMQQVEELLELSEFLETAIKIGGVFSSNSAGVDVAGNNTEGAANKVDENRQFIKILTVLLLVNYIL